MNTQDAPGFRIFGPDHVVYGPVELPALVGWVREKRVTAETWVYVESSDTWLKAPEVPELKMFFRSKPASVAMEGAPSIKPGTLRRVKVLAGLSDDQLCQFIDFMEVARVRQWAELVRQGEHGDAMYLVLEGELRVRMMIEGRESILTTLSPGDFFGEMALFDQGPRSADVVANSDSTLLKVSARNFERLAREAPELAAPILLSIGKTMVARIRADNKRFKDSVNFARSSH